ncbi:Pyridoxal phosphate phosphatase YbhA [Planctomycetes bacterium Poly30]|uniref:Pyridoxal phosphate phosphatase YbhA n=1 Tax=Saltatorellus ferox TaxID=2528018 RepID=A0A518EUY2_9BACT|nr:Pyridoxal phosphate phosphatase YbhA [Planctomycetes bacterium Poly30]
MARDYDAILLDLDGTLLTPEETIHPETRAALKEAEAAGVTVMVATGRSKTSGMPIVEDLGLRTPAIFFNGCAIWDVEKGRMVEERTISNRTNQRLHAWAAERDAQVIVMTASEKLTHEPRSEEERRNFDGFIDLQFVERDQLLREFTIRLSFLVNCGEESSHTIAAELEAAAGGPIYVSHFPLSVLPRHRTNPYSAIDVHAPCRGKAEGLRFLEETKGIPASRVIAVGDADNDIPMLQYAGLGVAMAGALPEVKAHADLVIGSNSSAAIAELIRERLLSRSS